MNIPRHRKVIDNLDARIVQLLNQRTRHVLEIGRIKRKAGKEIYAPHREQAVLDHVARSNRGPMTDEHLRAIYREVMSSALALEKTMTIAYPGPESGVSHHAATWRFGSSLRYASKKTVQGVFAAVAQGRADYGVVPMDGRTGLVPRVLELFANADLKIVSQIVMPAEKRTQSQTGRSWRAGPARFAVLGRHCGPPTGQDRTSLLVGVVKKAGPPSKALDAFRRHNVNVRRIESYSSKRRGPFFLIDCDGHANDKNLAAAIRYMAKQYPFIRTIGSYPKAD